MLVSQAHSSIQQARLAITLAWIAGYANVVAVLACGHVVSHVTGTVSDVGRLTVEGKWSTAGFFVFVLIMFVIGAALATFLTEVGKRRGWESIYVLPIAVQALLLSAFGVGVSSVELGQRAEGGLLWSLLALASMAMGLQNATITQISSGVVRTTHLTGVLTDIGSEAVRLCLALRNLSPRSFRVHPSSRRLLVLISIAGSFALGAGLGALVYEWSPTSQWAMALPVLFLAWIIVQDVRTPICEIQPSDLVSEDLSLPAHIGVFHLRKPMRTKVTSLHRLPDLLRWSETLAPSLRIIVLDLADVTVLDEDAGLELAALFQESARTGRQVILAGLTAGQYHELQQSSACSMLNATVVCPDVEFALARALALDSER